MTIDLADLPAHKCDLMLRHNPHRSNRESVEEYIEHNETPWISEEQKALAVANDEMWEMHWYPDTPVGFIHYAAFSPAALIAHCKDMT